MFADYCLHNFSYIADKGCGLAIVNYLQLTQTRSELLLFNAGHD